jgi:hypothetical protein
VTLLPFHIIAGAIGILSGAVALYAVKGGVLHRKSGMIFVCAMLVMSGSVAVIAAWHPNWATVLQGVLTFYLVTTGLLTVRRPAGSRWIDVGAMLVALTVGTTHIAFGLEASYSPTGTKYGYPPPLYFIFGPLALLAAFGDIRMLRARGLHGFHRIARHLWRMCFALFIASASFFLGQAKVIPAPLRIYPVLIALALLPLVLMLYWLVRVRRNPRHSAARLYATRVSA